MILVRHGESAPAIPGVLFDLLDGQGDPDLAPDGVTQAAAVADRLANAELDEIYVTTLRRTRQTADPLLTKLGMEPLVSADLREVGFGEWEGGLFRQKVAERHPASIRLYQELRWDVIPGAEPDSDFAERVHRGITAIHAEQRGKRVAVFTHSGVIGAIISLAVGCPRMAFAGSDNGSITRLVVDGPQWHVRSFNDTAHLVG
jgi:probable phosphoglycerate mutase